MLFYKQSDVIMFKKQGQEWGQPYVENMPSLTSENQSMSIREIVERTRKGQSPEVLKLVYYDENEDITQDPDFDLSDITKFEKEKEERREFFLKNKKKPARGNNEVVTERAQADNLKQDGAIERSVERDNEAKEKVAASRSGESK